MRRPEIQTAIEIFYTHTELECGDIKRLFGGKISSTTVTKLKKLAREQMFEDGKETWSPTAVNTVSAFKAWKIDVEDYEKRRDKLKKLGLGVPA